MIEGVRRANDFGVRVQLTNQVVGLFPEHRIKIAIFAVPGVVRFVPDFVAVKVLVARFELVVDDRGNLGFPVVHILELIRPAGQDVGQANLDFRANAFDTGGHQERATNTLLAAVTAAGRSKEHIGLERSHVLFDVARKILGQAVERTRGHMGHRLDAITQADVQVYCGKTAGRKQEKRQNAATGKMEYCSFHYHSSLGAITARFLSQSQRKIPSSGGIWRLRDKNSMDKLSTHKKFTTGQIRGILRRAGRKMIIFIRSTY